MPRLVILSLLLLLSSQSFSQSAQEPMRIASLAPHLTEWVYSLEKGKDIVAVSSYSDFPEDAKRHPVIADVNGVNLTKLVELNPDLVLVWQSNAKLGQIDKMKQLGLNVYVSNPHTIDDIHKEVSEIGALLHKPKVASAYINSFQNELNQLTKKYSSNKTTPVFFQLWHTPLMTANGNTMVNQILQICGLENVFANSEINYPTVTKEQVMLKMPEYIVISEMENTEVQTKIWRDLTMIPAVKNNRIINLNPDHLHRYSKRVLIAANELCEKVH